MRHYIVSLSMRSMCCRALYKGAILLKIVNPLRGSKKGGMQGWGRGMGAFQSMSHAL
ncbi:MAG: hypothetical protein NVSMB44_28350 [Ktedonobacteraceae bacterium]